MFFTKDIESILNKEESLLGIGSVSKTSAGPQVWQSRSRNTRRFRSHLVDLVLEYIMNAFFFCMFINLACLVITWRARRLSWQFLITCIMDFCLGAALSEHHASVGDGWAIAGGWAIAIGFFGQLFMVIWYHVTPVPACPQCASRRDQEEG